MMSANARQQQPNGSSLAPEHIADLQRSGLTDETIAAAGLRSVTAQEARALFGRSDLGSGYLIPYARCQWKGGGQYHRLRLDEPITTTDGHSMRYVTKAGEGNRLYVPPNLPEGILADPSKQLAGTEGEKKALKACQEGIACIGLAGVWSWRTRVDGNSVTLPDFDAVVWQRRPVVIAFDSDSVSNVSVYRAREALAQELTKRGAQVRIPQLPAGPGGEKTGLDDFLVRRCRDDFHALVDSSPIWTPRPVIYASCQILPEVTRQSWAALSRGNDPPRLFRHGGIPVRLENDDEGTPLLRPLHVDRLRHELARAADWRAQKKENGKLIEVPAKPPIDVVRDVLACPDTLLPVLTRIVEVPTFGADGTLHMSAGYHAGPRIYYAPPPGIVVPAVAEDPTPAEVCAAVEVILELICDFPFVDAADGAHAVALLLLPFVRDLIDGPTPNHLIEAATPGCGKGLLAEVLLAPAVGGHPGVVAWTSDDDELRKRITAQLLEGRTAILFDNVTRSLESGVLAAALTAMIWEDRVLGRSETARVPVRCAWVTTGNNPTMSTEMARRSIRIRLDPKTDRPWLRTNFKHDNLRDWANENRGRLIWAALTLVRAWLATGRPKPKSRPLGSYEKWTTVVGGILEHADIGGFLDNLTEFYELADSEGAVWREFVDVWWDRFQDNDVGTSDLFPLASEMEGFDLGKGGEQSQRTAFGKQLGKQRDRVIGDYRVVWAGKAKRANRWKLMRMAPEGVGALESGEHGERG